MTGWIKATDRMPEPGTLICKRWQPAGTVWAGLYHGGPKESSFDEWCQLPVGAAPRATQAIDEVPIDQRVKALVERLKAAEDHDAAELVERLHSRLEHAWYWYGTRHKRLWHWAHDELNEHQRTRYFNIVANGTADVNESPDYAQQFNTMKYRMERAEAELAAKRERWKAKAKAADTALQEAAADLAGCAKHPDDAAEPLRRLADARIALKA